MKSSSSPSFVGVFISSAILLTLPLSSSANSRNKDVDMITLGQVPYGFVTPEGEKKGAFYDILNEIMSVSHIGNSNRLIPFKRVLAQITAHKNVCTIAANDNENKAVFDLVEPVGFKLSAGVLPGPAIDLNDYSNLKGIRIAVPLGAYISEKFHDDQDLIKVTSSKYTNAMKMLKTGRVDAVAGAMPALMYISQTQGIDKKYFGKPLVLQSYDVYLLCSYDLAEDARSILKKTLIELKSNGKIKQILDSYF
jgi:ABC-type amino acid transport substrate-binding protein